jgi:hypothetical protein
MASYTNLNLTRLADAALQAFVKTLAPLNVFSRSFSPVAVAERMRGSGIAVPLIGTMSGTTFGGSYAICGGTKTVITVTLNRHKVVHVGQSDIDALNNSDSGLSTFGEEQGAALATTVIEDILTLVTTANFGLAANTTAANLDLTQLRAARLSLNLGNAPLRPRACLIDAIGMDALLGVTNFIQAQMFSDNTVLREGRVMRALGFDFYELNSSFVSAASVNAFFAHPSAIAIAMRYVQPQNTDGYWAAEQVSDPATGASFGIRGVYDPLTGQNYLAFECNYGYSAGITNGGRIVGRKD